jgi:hypothetical protein
MKARRSSRRRIVDDGTDTLVIGWSPEASCWRVLFRGSGRAYLDWFVPFSLNAGSDDPPFAIGHCGRDESAEEISSRLLRLPPPPPQAEPGQLFAYLSAAELH